MPEIIDIILCLQSYPRYEVNIYRVFEVMSKIYQVNGGKSSKCAMIMEWIGRLPVRVGTS